MFIADTAALQHDSIVLSGPEGRHAATVRRLSAGERADVSDGAGAVAECVVTAVGQAVVEFRVLARHSEPVPEPRIVVVQAIPKGDRAELAVELMTEVGADVVLPWQAERCVVQWRGDRGARALDRWRRTAREAAKQSRRRRFPDVPEPLALPGVMARIAAASLAVILDPEAPTALARLGRLPGRDRRDRRAGGGRERRRGSRAGRGGRGERPPRSDHHADLNGRGGRDSRAARRVRSLGLARCRPATSGWPASARRPASFRPPAGQLPPARQLPPASFRWPNGRIGRAPEISACSSWPGPGWRPDSRARWEARCRPGS